MQVSSKFFLTDKHSFNKLYKTHKIACSDFKILVIPVNVGGVNSIIQIFELSAFH